MRKKMSPNRPKQEIKHTQYPVNLKMQHTMRWLSTENKDSHKILIHLVKNGTNSN